MIELLIKLLIEVMYIIEVMWGCIYVSGDLRICDTFCACKRFRSTSGFHVHKGFMELSLVISNGFSFPIIRMITPASYMSTLI